METVPSPVTLRHASIDIPKEGACHGEGRDRISAALGRYLGCRRMPFTAAPTQLTLGTRQKAHSCSPGAASLPSTEGMCNPCALQS